MYDDANIMTRTSGKDSDPRGGGSLIFSLLRRLGPFWGFKMLNFIFFWGGGVGGGLRKLKMFGV